MESIPVFQHWRTGSTGGASVAVQWSRLPLQFTGALDVPSLQCGFAAGDLQLKKLPDARNCHWVWYSNHDCLCTALRGAAGVPLSVLQQQTGPQCLRAVPLICTVHQHQALDLLLTALGSFLFLHNAVDVNTGCPEYRSMATPLWRYSAVSRVFSGMNTSLLLFLRFRADDAWLLQCSSLPPHQHRCMWNTSAVLLECIGAGRYLPFLH